MTPHFGPGQGSRLLALWFVAWVSCATPCFAQPASAPEPYRLGAGDKVSVLVFGQADFSTDTMLDEAGAVALPLLGGVVIGGLTTSEAEKEIAGKLSQGYLERPAVTVRLQEYRPIYVLGTVRNPGGYPFRYGLSVLAAVALAGGVGVPEQSVTARSDFLQAHERLSVLERTYRQLTIRRARLEAQRGDKSDLVLPDGLKQDEDREIRDQETEQLKAQRQAQSERLQLLRAQKPRIEAEIEGVRAQSAAEQRQLELIQAHLRSYSDLMARGLARQYTGIELQREEARNKGNIGRLAADLARLEIGIGEVALRINEAEESYLRRIMTELAEVSQKLQELELTIPIARELRAAKLIQGGEMPVDDSSLRIVVSRAGSSGRMTVEATSDLALRPGDIVQVSRKAGAPARAFTSLFEDRAAAPAR